MRLASAKKYLNIFFKSPVLYILKSKVRAPVTINNVWDSEEDNGRIGEVLDVALVCAETCVALIYVLGTWDARNHQSSLPLRG